MTTSLTCPKCAGEMRSYERNGVTVDQCTECRGIFLDRGELEHLIAADSRAHTSAPAAAPPPRSDSHDYRRDHDEHRGSSGSSGSSGSYSSKRKKHWVEELFG